MLCSVVKHGENGLSTKEMQGDTRDVVEGVSPHFFEDETTETLSKRNYVYYTGVRRVLYLLPYISLRENLQNSDSSFRFPFEDFRNVNYGAWHALLLLTGSLVPNFTFN